MKSLDIILSDLKVHIEHRYDYMRDFCADYIAQIDSVDMVAIADDDAVANEKQLVPTAPIESCESLCVYRDIAEQLPKFDRFVFHGAAIEYNGDAYLFTAPSGTGKTTHINLWRKYLGDEISIINGDKPIIHAGEDVVVYGTPWAGKEGYQRNTKASLKAICVLKQSKTNEIKKLETNEAVKHLMRQIYLPQDGVSLSKSLELLGRMLEKIEVYELACDISEEAFKTSFNEMTN